MIGTWRAARDEDDGVTEAEIRRALADLDPVSDELFPTGQARIRRLVVEQVDISDDGADVQLRVDGLPGPVRDLGVLVVA